SAGSAAVPLPAARARSLLSRLEPWHRLAAGALAARRGRRPPGGRQPRPRPQAARLAASRRLALASTTRPPARGEPLRHRPDRSDPPRPDARPRCLVRITGGGGTDGREDAREAPSRRGAVPDSAGRADRPAVGVGPRHRDARASGGEAAPLPHGRTQALRIPRSAQHPLRRRRQAAPRQPARAVYGYRRGRLADPGDDSPRAAGGGFARPHLAAPRQRSGHLLADRAATAPQPLGLRTRPGKRARPPLAPPGSRLLGPALAARQRAGRGGLASVRDRWLHGRSGARRGGVMAITRVCIYTRISTDEENQPTSLHSQRERLEAFCAAQEGWRIVAHKQDQATGTKLDRPGLRAALDLARSGAVDMLLVYRVDRLSRKVRQLAQLTEELDGLGVVLKSATEPFDTGSAAGRMMLQMLAVFAEFEHATIVDRISAGIERRAKEGRWFGGRPPFGYTFSNEERALVPDPVKAPVVRRVFDLYAHKRLGTRTIAQLLRDE